MTRYSSYTKLYLSVAVSGLELLEDCEITEAFKILDPRELKVIKYRFTKPSKTLKEIAEIMSLTPERIRQIEKRSLRKIRLLLYNPKD